MLSLRNVCLTCVKEEKINWETHKRAHKCTVCIWSSKWCNHRKDHNTTQELRIRDYSLWKKTHFLDWLCIFLRNSPTELLCIVISITLSVRVVGLTNTQTLWLRSLLALGRQAQHYVLAKCSLISPIIGPHHQSSVRNKTRVVSKSFFFSFFSQSNTHLDE